MWSPSRSIIFTPPEWKCSLSIIFWNNEKLQCSWQVSSHEGPTWKPCLEEDWGTEPSAWGRVALGGMGPVGRTAVRTRGSKSQQQAWSQYRRTFSTTKAKCVSESGSSRHSAGARSAWRTPLMSGEKALSGLRNQAVREQACRCQKGSCSTTGWEDLEMQGQMFSHGKVRQHQQVKPHQ